MKQYTLYLGHNRQDRLPLSDYEVNSFIKKMASMKLQSFTVCRNTGYWRGGGEDTTTITIITNDHNGERDVLLDIAREYIKNYNQECVMLTECNVNVSFIKLRQEVISNGRIQMEGLAGWQ